MTKRDPVEREIRTRSRRSFLLAGLAAGTGFAGFKWLTSRREDDGVPWPLRLVLEVNEQLWRDYFRTTRLAPEYPRAMSALPRENGSMGLEEDFDIAAWKLDVVDGVTQTRQLTLGDVKSYPRVEMTTELKCIEGWSQIVHWAGARFSDLIEDVDAADSSYVGLATPDGGYYAGLDMDSAMHPQTLLCYEMNGEPLTLEHGAPLRLAIPVKYGIKNIKRIGTIRFTNTRPADYWAEHGYDWYAGL